MAISKDISLVEVFASLSLSFFLQRNEPCSLPVTVEMIAAYLNKTPEEVKITISINSITISATISINSITTSTTTSINFIPTFTTLTIMIFRSPWPPPSMPSRSSACLRRREGESSWSKDKSYHSSKLTRRQLSSSETIFSELTTTVVGIDHSCLKKRSNVRRRLKSAKLLCCLSSTQYIVHLCNQIFSLATQS